MKKILIIALLPVAMLACKKGGLGDKTTGLTEEAVFTDSLQTTNFLNKIYVDAGYTFGPSRFAGAGGSGNTELATDNAEGNNNLAVWGNAYAQGTIGPSNVITPAYFGTDKDFWTTPYKNIRRVNIFLEKIGGAPFHESTKKRMRAEARFLRAFYYHHMVIAFGGVPLIGDKVFGINDIINIPRGTYEECVSYMVSELDAAAADLANVVYKDIDFGKITRGACLALKSRVLLYAASPLFNGGGISQSAVAGYPTFSASRWQQAADAAEALINTNVYSLNVDNTTRPGNGFYQLFLKRVNSEYIFQYGRPAQKEFEAYYLPPTRTGASIMKPTQSLVEAFPMRDGKTITESSSYNPNDPYVNRDPRFEYSIIYNGLSYINNSSVKTVIYTYMTTPTTIANTTSDAYTSSNQFTGYFSRKMCDENISNGLAATTERAWPLIRYAEILLNYAEAINEVGQPEKAVEKIVLLRNRAGILPGSDNRYGIKVGITVDELRTLIQNERRIEFAFEDHRWNDIRRWKIASTVLKGFNSIDIITRPTTNTFVHTISRAPRPLNFRNAMYLLPIPLSEIQKMPLMEQNPEY